jgi:hypothetical protein
VQQSGSPSESDLSEVSNGGSSGWANNGGMEMGGANGSPGIVKYYVF